MRYQVQENCLTIYLPREVDHHNADEIRKCIDARAKTDGELELTLTTGGETGSLHAVLTIDDKKYKKKRRY